MQSPAAQDLNFIENAAQSLGDYVLSDLLYWPMDIRPASAVNSVSRTTLGVLYLIIEHLRRQRLSEDQEERFSICMAEIEKIRRKWNAAWQKKAAMEFKARTRQWYNFIHDCIEDDGELRPRYSVEVQNRVILQLLLLDIPENETGLVLALHKVDEFLKNILGEGKFVWDEQLQSTFSEDKFWFLYRNL